MARKAGRQTTGPLARPARRSGRLTFGQYLDFRLGHGARRRWFNFFIRPFGARSFAEFWRLWNPVYGYFLVYFVYRPASRRMPRPVAVMLTFVACGLVLHDLPAWLFTRRILPPGATIAFTFFGIGVVVTEALRMNLARWPVLVRAAVNLTYLAGSVGAMLLIVSRIVR